MSECKIVTWNEWWRKRKGKPVQITCARQSGRGPGSGVRGPGSGVRVPGFGVRGPGSGVRGPGLVYVAFDCVFLWGITICRWNKLTLLDQSNLQLTVSLSYLDFKLERPLGYPNPLSAAELETAIFSILDTKIAAGFKCSRTLWNDSELLPYSTASRISEDSGS